MRNHLNGYSTWYRTKVFRESRNIYPTCKQELVSNTSFKAAIKTTKIWAHKKGDIEKIWQSSTLAVKFVRSSALLNSFTNVIHEELVRSTIGQNSDVNGRNSKIADLKSDANNGFNSRRNLREPG